MREREELARRLAPVLVLWPEIPADSNPDSGLRDEHVHRPDTSPSRRVSGAHIRRDFHPRDVRSILDNAEAYQPRPPLPFTTVAFARAYRDLAHVFFWPLVVLVVLALLVIGLAQGLPQEARVPIELGAFVFTAILFLMTLRSPIHAPTNSWHLVNHSVMGLALAVMWFVIRGTVDVLVFISFAVPGAITVYLWVLLKLRATLLLPYRLLRFAIRKLLGRRASHLLRESIVRGSKPADQYTHESELFYRFPGENRAINRSDREGHWAAYSRILSQGDYPRVFYARVLDPDEDEIVVIQYWFNYYYDDWATEHEGDWEMACVLAKDGVPMEVAAAQHEGGEVRAWNNLESRDSHVVLYVAAGSHALYFEAGAHLTTREMFGLEIGAVDAPVVGGTVLKFADFAPRRSEGTTLDDAKVLLIPEPDTETGLWGHTEHSEKCSGNCELNFEWLNFRGHWGAAAFLPGSASGPRGPAYTGLRWDDPRMWVDVVCRKGRRRGDAVGVTGSVHVRPSAAAALPLRDEAAHRGWFRHGLGAQIRPVVSQAGFPLCGPWETSSSAGCREYCRMQWICG